MSPQLQASEDWAIKTLGECAEVLDNLRVPLSAAQRAGRVGPYPYCGANAVLDYIDNYMIDDDVVLLAEDGGNFDQFQTRSIAYRMKGKMWVNNHAHVLKAARGADTGFLFYCLEHKDIRPFISSGTRSKLTRGELVRITVAIPPDWAEQHRIAAVLSEADQLIASLERLIAKKEAMKQGMMQELLAGKTRLPGFTKTWDKATVGDIASVKTGPFGSALHERDYVAFGTPIITVEHLGKRGVVPVGVPRISNRDLKRLKAYQLKDGDVVFSRVGSIDRNALISLHEVGWLFSGRLLRIRFDLARANPKFMSYQFHGRAFREAVRSVAVGQTMPSLSTSILRGIPIDLPSVREQAAIGSLLRDIDRELDAIEGDLAKAKAIKQGMMQELLTGRTRLPNLETAAA